MKDISKWVIFPGIFFLTLVISNLTISMLMIVLSCFPTHHMQ